MTILQKLDVQSIGTLNNNEGANLTNNDTLIVFRAFINDGIFINPGTLNSLPVDIKIKPGDDEPTINIKSNGKVSVAILGSDSFDVQDIDVVTLGFALNSVSPSHDLTNPAVISSHLADVNSDGMIDLVSHYKQKQTGLVKVDTQSCIFGSLNDGTVFSGCDSVRVR